MRSGEAVTSEYRLVGSWIFASSGAKLRVYLGPEGHMQVRWTKPPSGSNVKCLRAVVGILAAVADQLEAQRAH